MYELSECCLKSNQFVVAEKIIRELIPLLGDFAEGQFNSQLLLVRAVSGQGRADEARKMGEELALQAIKDRQAKRVTRARIVLDEVYRKGRINNTANDLVTKLHLRKCPLCGTTTDLLPIGYGLVLGSAKDHPEAGVTVHYGGCCVEPYHLYCKSCCQEF